MSPRSLASLSLSSPDVYSLPGRELYRKWVGLVNTSDDEGLQGYLQLSIAVWGAGDVPVPRDLRREKRARANRLMKENAAAANKPDSMALRMPEIVKTLRFVVLTFHVGEHLPATDAPAFPGGSYGIDAYMACCICGGWAIGGLSLD